jgi:hypothetical protein
MSSKYSISIIRSANAFFVNITNNLKNSVVHKETWLCSPRDDIRVLADRKVEILEMITKYRCNTVKTNSELVADAISAAVRGE